MAYTSSDILTSIKRNNTIFSTDFRFSDDDILAMVDEEIESTIVPMILRLHSDRLLFNSNVFLENNRKLYPVPYRAIGSNIKTVWHENRELENIEFSNADSEHNKGRPSQYYFVGDDIALVPTPTANCGELTFSYFIKHSRLVSNINVAVVSNVDYSTGEITLATNANKSFSGRSMYDFIAANARCKPHILAIDIAVARIDGNKMQFKPELLPKNLQAGDRVSLAGQTDVLLLPDECYKYLIKAAGVKILEAQKDLQALAAFKPDLDRARNIMEGVLSPRVSGKPRPYVNGNRLLNKPRIHKSLRI
ncbi:hypothetical protein [Fluviispira vulneris]|uniref:hypothetical protein n=1 Tax=Fluviispira vulneris TaxID=2763012 RepID=UPI0016490F12|nr:hypothetical protein [Fluviispira vulneris]